MDWITAEEQAAAPREEDENPLRPYRHLAGPQLAGQLAHASLEASDERLTLATRKRARTRVWALHAERLARGGQP